jgi:hypothetical protein
MIRNSANGIFFLILTALFFSCDKIDAPYAEVNVSSIDTLQFPSPSFAINPDEPRRVLIEDFTGHTCGNCPTAAIQLENLITSSGGKVIGVAIHAGETFAAPAPPTYPEDYRTEVGDAIDAQFGITSAGQPNGMVNRIKTGNVYYTIPNAWSNRVNAILNNTPQADAQIGIKAYYDEEKERIIAYVHAGFLTSLSGNFRLAAYAIEDSVIGDQKWYNQGLPNDHDENYVFNHTLRGNVSSLWGEDIAVNPQAGSVYRKVWVLKLKPEWKPKHMKVVAFVYNKDNFEIIQPGEAKPEL